MGDPPDLGKPWLWALRLALGAALMAAILLARRRVEYRPTAALLAWAGLAHVVRPLLHIVVLVPARAAGRLPYVGLERAAFHVEQAVFVSWPLAITALAVWTFWRRRPWPVALAWLAVAAALAASYPAVRGPLLASVYLGVTLAALAVSIGAATTWWRSKAPAEPPEIAALLFIVCEIGATLGPYAAGPIDKVWPIAQGLYFGLYAILFALEVAWLRPRQ